MEKDRIKEVVKDFYGQVASQGSCCGGCGCGKSANYQIAKSIGYSEDEINTASMANLGLGCGNPTALRNIAEGATVLDLGSGAGFDCFLVAKKVGSSGRVIGIDFSDEMIALARQNAIEIGQNNVEFRHGDIESLPVEDNSVDVVISNCVINLAPDKPKVFAESYRVLKDGGTMLVSDIVLLEEIPDEIRNNEELVGGCVGGAILKDEYIAAVESAGFKVTILSEDKDISKRQYSDMPLESLKIEAVK